MSEKHQPLPVGTVVNVKGDDRNLAIIGQLPVVELHGEQGYFEFSAVALPVGVTGPDLIFFNSENIEKVVFLGYVDAAFQQLAGRYDDMIASGDGKMRRFTIADAAAPKEDRDADEA